MLEICLLGPLEVRSATGEDITPVGPREQAAIVVLALASPTAIATERLAHELYGEESTTDPRNAVQAVVSRLRKALGRSAGTLETHGTGYRLVDIGLDVDRAESGINEAHGLSGPLKRARLEQALSTWRGPTLHDMAPSEALNAERFRIEELKAGAEDALFELRLESQSSDLDSDPSLVADLEAAVHRTPMREGRWALLMRALYSNGRQADALRAFQRARRLLGEQLGLEPGPALTNLEQQILSQDPALARSGFEPQPMPQQTPQVDPLPSGTVSVLLCDVEGSVRQWEAAPESTASRIADLHDVWSSVVADHDGSLIKSTGDGVLAVFHTAADAVRCAVAGQQVHHRNPDLKVRVAVNTGPAIPVEGDYRGPVVNRCARLLELAAGGQILATGTSAALARDGLDGEASLQGMGSHWLRDVPEPVDVSQVNATGIASDFPDLRSQGPVGLPRLRTTIVGRDELRASLAETVGQVSLVTLLGPGGIGKTTMALAVGWEVAGLRNVIFVDLAAVTDPASVPQRVADALVNAEDDRSPAQRISDRLRTNTDMVILDNAEHVLDAVAELLDKVLGHELKGSFVVTSRHPLALAGELVVAVPPLLLPSDDADLVATAATPAVALFLDRLKKAKPSEPLPSGLLPVVAHICRRLDGIPLAIELAAGRASVLAVEDIAARLDDQLRLLRQVPATRERRHRSLEAVVAWSLDHLTPESRRLFSLLSVFAGDFGLAGVESVMTHFGLDARDSVDQLSELSSASLLHVERGSRFRMLEPIRQYAAGELEQAELAGKARRAHARWIADLLVTAHEQEGAERSRHLRLLDPEADELRVALMRVVEDGLVDLVPDMAVAAGYWFVNHDPNRGAEIFGQVLDVCDPDKEPLAFALAAIGWATSSASHPAAPRPDSMARALEILERLDHPDRGLAHVVAGFGHLQVGEIAEAIQQLDNAETLISSDDRWAVAILDMAKASFSSLALMLHAPAPYDLLQAMQAGERAAAAFRLLEDEWALGITLGELGRLKQRLGDFEGAERCLLESVELFGDTEYHGLHYIMTEIGKLATLRGDHEAAANYHKQAMEIARRDGGSVCLAITYGGLAYSAEQSGEVDQAIQYLEQALALESADLKPGVPTAWEEDLARLQSK